MSPGRRRFGPRTPRMPAGILVVIVLLIFYRLWGSNDSRLPETLGEGNYRVERVVDGDTLLLENRIRVRLIGVDTPESVRPDHPVEPWGLEAAEFTRQFVAGGKVHLRFDRERVDQYGRHLAYVSVGDRMLNEELLRAGLARALLQYNYSASMKTRFRQAEAEARTAQRGIWSAPRPNDP